nr:titin homolog [Ciona intestinalis]|eukprot:XP_002131319.1 titin homolog [Ciona intestinalis]
MSCSEEGLLVSYYSAILAKACSVGDDFADLYDLIVKRCSKDQADHALEKARELSELKPQTLAIKVRWLEAKIPAALRLTADMASSLKTQSKEDDATRIRSKSCCQDVVVEVGKSVDVGISFPLTKTSMEIDARKKLANPVIEKFENENSIELGAMRKKSSKQRESSPCSNDESKSSKGKSNPEGASGKSSRSLRRKKLKEQKNKEEPQAAASISREETPVSKTKKLMNKENKRVEQNQTRQKKTTSTKTTDKPEDIEQQKEAKKLLTDEVVAKIAEEFDDKPEKKQKTSVKEKVQKKRKKKTKKMNMEDTKEQEAKQMKEQNENKNHLHDSLPTEQREDYDLEPVSDDPLLWQHNIGIPFMPYSRKGKTNLDSKGNSLASSSEECSSYTTGQSTPGINDLAPDTASGGSDVIEQMKPALPDDFPPIFGAEKLYEDDFINALKNGVGAVKENAVKEELNPDDGATGPPDSNEDPILSAEVGSILHNEWGLNFMPDSDEMNEIPPFELPCISDLGDAPVKEHKDIFFQEVDENQNTLTFSQEEFCFGFGPVQDGCKTIMLEGKQQIVDTVPLVQGSKLDLVKQLDDAGNFDLHQAVAFFQQEWEKCIKNGTKYENLGGI